jgi:hypothetical protein
LNGRVLEEALKCYQTVCGKDLGIPGVGSCEDDLKPETLLPCDAAESACIKETTMTKSGKKAIFRFCLAKSGDGVDSCESGHGSVKNLLERIGPLAEVFTNARLDLEEEASYTECKCQKDGCNGSINLKSSMILISLNILICKFMQA